MAERTYSHAQLSQMFPKGVPISVCMVVNRPELTARAKNRIIDEMVEDFRRLKRKIQNEG